MQIADEIAQRSLSARLDLAADEVRRIIDATYTVIARTGSLDPSLRAVLRESGCPNQTFYRLFPSKGDLMLAIYADGRQRLADDLRRLTAARTEPADQVEAWIRGVIRQATNPEAATRTRPFVAGIAWLEERFPDELRRSRDHIVDTLTAILAPARPDDSAYADALATYDLAFGTMQRHLLAGTTPSPDETDHLVTFALTALGLPQAHQ